MIFHVKKSTWKFCAKKSGRMLKSSWIEMHLIHLSPPLTLHHKVHLDRHASFTAAGRRLETRSWRRNSRRWGSWTPQHPWCFFICFRIFTAFLLRDVGLQLWQSFWASSTVFWQKLSSEVFSNPITWSCEAVGDTEIQPLFCMKSPTEIPQAWCNQETIQKVRESQAESILHDKCEWEAFEQHFFVNPRTVGTSSTNDAGLWQVAGCTRREFWRCDQLLKRPHSLIKHRPLGAQGDNMQNTLHLAAPTFCKPSNKLYASCYLMR